jgi:hypothetical protein
MEFFFFLLGTDTGHAVSRAVTRTQETDIETNGRGAQFNLRSVASADCVVIINELKKICKDAVSAFSNVLS